MEFDIVKICICIFAGLLLITGISLFIYGIYGIFTMYSKYMPIIKSIKETDLLLKKMRIDSGTEESYQKYKKEVLNGK